jgi:hypothetical protein
MRALVAFLRDTVTPRLVAFIAGVSETRATRQWAEGEREVAYPTSASSGCARRPTSRVRSPRRSTPRPPRHGCRAGSPCSTTAPPLGCSVTPPMPPTHHRARIGPALRRPVTRPAVRRRAEVTTVRVGRRPGRLRFVPLATGAGKVATTIPTGLGGPCTSLVTRTAPGSKCSVGSARTTTCGCPARHRRRGRRPGARSPPVAFLCRGCPTAAWAMRASREGSPTSATQTPCAGSRQDYRSSSFKAGCVTLTSPPPPDRTDISPGDRARTAPSRHHARHRVPVALRREDLVPGGGSKRRRPPRHRPRRRGPRPFHRGRRPRPGTRNATPPSVVRSCCQCWPPNVGRPGNRPRRNPRCARSATSATRAKLQIELELSPSDRDVHDSPSWLAYLRGTNPTSGRGVALQALTRAPSSSSCSRRSRRTPPNLCRRIDKPISFRRATGTVGFVPAQRLGLAATTTPRFTCQSLRRAPSRAHTPEGRSTKCLFSRIAPSHLTSYS